MTKTATPGIATEKLPRCLGIPVSYDPALCVISDSRGIWPRKKIMVGPAFWGLTERQKGAVLLHEAGHCKLFHTERLIGYTLIRPRLIFALVAASIAAARRFRTHSAEAILWFQNEVQRRAPGIAPYRQKLEAQADRFAAACGYAEELAQVFLMMSGSGPFHAEPAARAASLRPPTGGVFDTSPPQGIPSPP